MQLSQLKSYNSERENQRAKILIAILIIFLLANQLITKPIIYIKHTFLGISTVE